ncbi:MAG TPA: hypothetical protein VIF62_28455 [Labilithrix sp.]|jgi:hypothetical protein
MVFVLVSSAFPTFAAFAACTSENLPPAGTAPSTVQPGNATGAGSEAGGGGDSGGGGDGGGVCNQLMFGGKLVDALNVQGDPNPPSGGTILDGDYDLTVVNVYVGVTGVAGPAGFSEQSSINVTSGAIQRLITIVNTMTNTTTTENDTGTISVPDSGATTAVISVACPASGFLQYDFSATGTSLRLVDTVTKKELTYTKR